MNTSTDSGSVECGKAVSRTLGRGYALLLAGAALFLMGLSLKALLSEDAVPAAAASVVQGRAGACPVDSRRGAAVFDDDLLTPAGLHVRVRTPTNYVPTNAYPLLVVFPPAGMGRSAAENYYRLTTEATGRGFVVAYSDHVPLSRSALRLQMQVAPVVMAHWCIGKNQVVYLGHSDGGSIAEGSQLSIAKGVVHPAALVASAAGIRGSDLDSLVCPRSLSVMIIHSRDDRLFPGFGKETAFQWARCAGCSTRLEPAQTSGCSQFSGCSNVRQVTYCEVDGPHARWPEINHAALAFAQHAIEDRKDQ